MAQDTRNHGKKAKFKVREVSINDGIHVHGIIVAPQENRLKSLCFFCAVVRTVSAQIGQKVGQAESRGSKRELDFVSTSSRHLHLHQPFFL
jgi:hypothetical protein